MSVFFTSDLHFHHKRICEFTDRGNYTTPEEHTDWLVDIWNKQVGVADLVYHLGDFSFAKTTHEIRQVLQRLNGQKLFIKGNHCKREDYNILRKENYIQWWGDYKEIYIQKTATCLFHFPIMSWHKQGYGAYHLHGHCHGNLKAPIGKMLDVGIDNAYNLFGEHRLFTEQDIIDYMAEQQLYISDHHKDRSTT